MKKSEFKALIRPTIKECIKESLLEDGLISGIIAEVVKGMNQKPIVESKAPQQDATIERMRRNAFTKEESNKLTAQKKQLLSAIGENSYNGVDIFEGTTPAPAPPSPGASPSHGSLAGVAPGDQGVDISNLFNTVGHNWSAHMSKVAEEE